MIRWTYFPKNRRLDALSEQIVKNFELVSKEISSNSDETRDLKSNEVLEILRPRMEEIGFDVESDKSTIGRVNVPVLFGENGRVEKSFDADCYHATMRYVIEVEAGRAVANYQFLKDLFQCCVMVEVDFLAIAVKLRYRDKKDYETVCTFMDTLFASGRLSLPLKGILVIGY